MAVTISGSSGTTQPTATCTTSLVLNGSTSGTSTLVAPAVAGGTTITLPSASGTLITSATGTITLGTPVTASGTSVTFTGIPSTAKRIIMMLNGVSTSGSSNYLVQLGTSGGFVTSGYSGATQGGGVSSNNAGIILLTPAAGTSESGNVMICLLDPTNYVWSESASLGDGGNSASNIYNNSGWSVTLSGVLTQIRLTTANGTDTFDAGKVNISYE